MKVEREQFRFPTRQFPYRNPQAGGFRTLEQPDPAAFGDLEPGKIYRFVLGIDPFPSVMPAKEAKTTLQDPFAELLLEQGIFPRTTRELLRELDRSDHLPEGVGNQSVFLVAEGGQVPWSQETATLNRGLRFAISREGAANRFILISTSTALDSESQFLQVLAWDNSNEVYHFYERRGGAWVWAGSSLHALAPETRGRGPFDSHVNGSLVMKELRAPWIHWHSMDASILPDILDPDDPLRSEPLFLNKKGAQELESLVRARIALWNRSRLRHATSADASKLTDVLDLFRQILTTTTVNLATTHRPSQLVTNDEDLMLPTTFFLNTDAMDHIGLSPVIEPIRVEGRLYRETLQSFGFHAADRESGFRQEGDVFFAFLVPEPAFEDTNVLEILLQEQLISRKFAACLFMIDFQNPIYSSRRQKLLEHIPGTARRMSGPIATDIEDQFIVSVSADSPFGSPEDEFLCNWIIPDWGKVFGKRIEDYVSSLHSVARSSAGFHDWTRLAESRRREFRKKPLAEFSLTMPRTNIPEAAPLLEMNIDGTVGIRASTEE